MADKIKTIKMIKKSWEEKAFTILEILVTITMVLFLTALVFFAHREGETTFLLQREAQKAVQDIRKAQEMAISTIECEKCSGGGIPEGGYGIHFEKDSSSYFIYADSDTPLGQYDSPDDVISTIELEKVVVSEIRDKNGSKFNDVSINFQPPDPVISITSPSDLDLVYIQVSLGSDPDRYRTILVNKSGLIEVN